MPACALCDDPLPDGSHTCPACGTSTAFLIDAARDTQGHATRAAAAARNDVGKLRASGVDPAVVERLVERADAEVQQGRFGPALAYAQAARRAAEIAQTRARLQRERARVEEVVGRAKQAGIDTKAAEEALQEASNRLAQGDLQSVPVWLHKASFRAAHGHRARSAESTVGSAERAIRHAKERGADVGEAHQELQRAREALRQESFHVAREAAAKAKDAADRVRKVSRYEKFVERAERMLHGARTSGANLGEARRLIAEARHALKEGGFAEAQRKSFEANEAIAEARRYRNAETLLERTLKATREEERRGVDMAGPSLAVGEAHDALEARDYRKVRELAREARDAIWNAVLARRLQGTMTILAADVGELKEIGADARDAETLLAEATAALEARDFDKCRRLASRCRRAADDAREARREEIIVRTVQKIVEAAGASGRIDADRVRDVIQDVEAMLAGGEAVDVEALVNARLARNDAERTKQVTKRLADVRAIVAELKRTDIEVADADDAIAIASAALDARQFEEAEGHLAELEEIAKGLSDTLRGAAAETLERARTAAGKARKAGIEIPDATRILETAETAFETNRVYEALEFGRLAQTRAESAWRHHFEQEAKRDIESMRAVAERVTRAREEIDLLAAQIESLNGVGVDVSPARDALGNAQQALQERRVDEVEAHLRATERLVEGMRASLRQRTGETMERVRQAVLEARAQGLMTVQMEAVLARAEQAVREEEHREAMARFEALDEALEHAREEKAAEQQQKELERMKKASDRILRIRRIVEELKKANIEIQGSDDALLEAEKSLTSRDFEAVDAHLGDLETTAREMRAELVAATRFLLGKAREAVEAAERAGLSVQDARQLLGSADTAMERGKLDDAIEFANTAKQRAEAATHLKSETEAREEKKRIETAREKIERLRRFLEDLQRADIAMDGGDEAMVRAEEALASRRYQDVYAILENTEALAETIKDGLRAAAEELCKKSQENVDVAKQEGLVVRRAELVLVNAAEAIRERRYVEAIEYHKVIDDIVEDAKRARAFRELEAEVQVLRTDLARTAALGADTRATEDLLHRAQEEVALGRFDRVADYTRQIREALTATRRQILEAKLDRGRVAIGKAQLLGASVPEAEALLPQAEKAVEAGDYEALAGLVRQIEEETAEASRTSLAAKADGDFLAVEALARQVSASGLAVPEAARFLDEARKLKQEGEYESMSQMLAEARRVLESTGHEHVVAQHRDKMRGLAGMLEAAKRIGANVAEPERILAQAEEALGSSDLALADILVKQAEVSTGLQIQSFIQNKYPNLVVKMPTRGLQANAWNKMVVEVANKGTLGAKNIDLKFEGDVEVRGVESIPELAADETKSLEVGVKPTREGDVPIDVRVFYKRYFDANTYEVAEKRQLKVESSGTYLVEDVFLTHAGGRLIAHESRRFRAEIDEDIFSGMLTVVQDFIRDSFRQRTQTGLKRLDFGQSKILIERSQHCFLTAVVLGSEPALLPLYMAEVLREIEAKYGDVLDDWSGMLDELAGVDEVVRKLVLVTEVGTAERGALAQSEVAEVDGLLRAAKEAGAETTEVEALLAKAQDSLETDMELALHLLADAKMQVQENRQRFLDRMKALVDQTGEVVEQLRALGADAGPAEILLKEAREAFQAGRFDKVEEIANQVRGTLERLERESMEKRVEGELSTLIQEIEQARGDGADVTHGEAFLVKIEDALQRKNFRSVEDLLRRAREGLREERTKSILKRSQREMEWLSSMLVEAKEFGAESPEAEGLLLRAQEAMAEGRTDDLDALVRQATAVAKNRVHEHLENKYPKLFLTMPSSGLQADAWNKIVLELANRGNLAAKNVQLSLTGDVEVRGLEPIPRIDPNERRQVAIGVKPKAPGALPLDVEVRYQRPLDERLYEQWENKEVKAERPGTYVVEDAFLIHRDGRLICHETLRFRDDVDEDVFSGMLTVVLNYVKESFQDRAEGGLRRLDFGENKIVFERGADAYLAAKVLGGEPVVLPLYMVDLLREIEDRYAGRLHEWTGFLTELEGIQDLIRRLLYVTEVPDADLGPLAGSPLAETMRLIAGATAEEEGAAFLQEARAVVESKGLHEASEFVRKAVRSYKEGREELHSQLREAVLTQGELSGLNLTNDQMKADIDIVRRVVDAVFAAREKAGMDRVWPVKRVGIKADTQVVMDAVTSFRKIIVNQSLAKELDLVAPGETWRGLKLTAHVNSEAIAKAYRLRARKIELLLLSQNAWNIKSGLDRGEYHVGVEGHRARIDPSMVSFTEAVPDQVVEETFEGGRVYVDTETTDDILGEGYARELVNVIRDVRKELKLRDDIPIETRIRATEAMEGLLKKWTGFISQETNAQAIVFVQEDLSDGYVVECNLGTETFTVSVRRAVGLVATE